MILAMCIASPAGNPSSAGSAAKIAGVAGAAGDDDVDIGLQRAAERARAHLADDVRGVGDVVLGQRRHVVEADDAAVCATPPAASAAECRRGSPPCGTAARRRARCREASPASRPDAAPRPPNRPSR